MIAHWLVSGLPLALFAPVLGIQFDLSAEALLVLTGAILCLPGSWTLSQKLGRALISIREPVPPYDGGIARRVQRLFDAIRPEQALWRMNFLTYDDAQLFQPRLEGQRRPRRWTMSSCAASGNACYACR